MLKLSPARAADPKQAVRLRGYVMAVATSGLATGLLVLWHWLNMIRTGPLILGLLPIAAFVSIFYFAFRTGRNRRYLDPSLTIPQMAAAACSLLWASFLADEGRALFLVLLAMVIVFGMLRLATRTLLVCAGSAAVGYAAVMLLLWIFKPETLDLHLELLQLLVFAVAMAWLALMGGHISGLREKLKLALREAEESERNLAEAQRLAQLGSWSFDPATGDAAWSAETCRIFGLNPVDHAVVGEAFRSLVHEEDRERCVQLFEGAVRDGKAYDTEYRVTLPSGAVRWVHALGRPSTNLSGGARAVQGTVMDITARKEAEDKIRHLAHFDALTGLPNRNLLMQLFRHAMARTLRRGAPLGLLFIDLDGFKQVNDSFGHEAGDLLLAAFGQRLSRCLRLSDTAARLGGDEFVVVVENYDDAEHLVAIARRVLVAASTPFRIADRDITVSASIGIALFPESASDMDGLLRSADSAMYAAKRSGRNRISFAEPVQLDRDGSVTRSESGTIETSARATSPGLILHPLMPVPDAP